MGGHPQAKTPNIHRIMRRGVRFTNAQTNDPLCAPSRPSLVSGLYPNTSGHYSFDYWRNNAVLSNTVTFMEHFKNNGYGVYGTGKILHNLHEDHSCYDEYQYEADFGPYAWDGSEPEGEVHHPSGSWMFEKRPAFRGGARDTFGPLSDVPNWKPGTKIKRQLFVTENKPGAGAQIIDTDQKKTSPGYHGWRLNKKPFRYVNENDRDLMPDEKNANYAVDVLSRKHENPFFLAVGFNRPHTPLYAPKKYFDLFPLDRLKLPDYLENDLDDCPEEIMRRFQPFGFYKYDLYKTAGGKELLRQWVQAYLACVAFADDQVGKVLNALEDSPYADNTIVIFASDHGFNMGEKEYVFKDCLWEESCRIPMVIALPHMKHAGSDCDHPVSLVDIYPTLIDLCHLPPNPNKDTNGYPLDGHSMRPFLEDPVHGEWDGPPVAFTLIGGYATKNIDPEEHKQIHYSVRTRRYRYSLYATGEEELYDHQQDPCEWYNLASDPKMHAVKNEMNEALKQFIKTS